MRKRKLKPAVKRCMLYTLSALLIGYGSFNIYTVYRDQKDQSTKTAEITTKVEKEFTEEKKEEDTSSEATVDDSIAIEGNVVGVMSIPAFDNFKHAIAMGVDSDVLHDYVGMYTSLGMIGEDNSNAVFSAHSALYGYSPISYFNRIDDKLKKGDEIDILWNDGNTYKYQVISVKQYVDASDRSALEQPADGKQYITLQTCTHGKPEYRSFIKAERIN